MSGSGPAFVLGILGGMGPLATADFFAKLVATTPAGEDTAHVPVVLASLPQIPPRVPAILHGGPSPLPALLGARERLVAAGATLLAMPCNTAHHWYDDLARGGPPFVHIADAAVDALCATGPVPARVGLVATAGTLASGFYRRRLAALGCAVLEPTPADLAEVIAPAVAAVKAGRVAEGGRAFQEAASRLAARGAGAVILACTEVPPALAAVGMPPGIACVDATEALARACVARWVAVRGNS